VTSFLRFIGILNAAVWCGAAVFLIIGLPAVFSDELKQSLGPMGVGLAAQAVVGRFFILQYFCAAIGLLHLVLENLCAGKTFSRGNLFLLLILTVFALAGGLWMQPKLKDLHHTKYLGTTPALRDEADHTFKAWHGASECGNLIVIGGLLLYLWRTSRPPGELHLGKFRD
jgi:hypothetical protein